MYLHNKKSITHLNIYLGPLQCNNIYNIRIYLPLGFKLEVFDIAIIENFGKYEINDESRLQHFQNVNVIKI